MKMSHSDLLLWGPHSWATVPATAAPPDLPSHLWQGHPSPELLPANYSQDTGTEPFLWEVGLLWWVNLTHTPTITLAKIFSELHCHVRVFLLLLSSFLPILLHRPDLHYGLKFLLLPLLYSSQSFISINLLHVSSHLAICFLRKQN